MSTSSYSVKDAKYFRTISLNSFRKVVLVEPFLAQSEVIWEFGKYCDVCNKQIKKQTVKFHLGFRGKGLLSLIGSLCIKQCCYLNTQW